jgi:hypothetical protein
MRTEGNVDLLRDSDVGRDCRAGHLRCRARKISRSLKLDHYSPRTGSVQPGMTLDAILRIRTAERYIEIQDMYGVVARDS